MDEWNLPSRQEGRGTAGAMLERGEGLEPPNAANRGLGEGAQKARETLTLSMFSLGGEVSKRLGVNIII